MKNLLLAAVVILVTTSVNAQDDVKKGGTTFELGANVGTGTKTGATTTYGANAQVNIPAGSKLKVTGSVGYQNLHFKSGNVKFDQSFALLKAGLLFNLASKLFLHPQLGYALYTGSGGGGHFSYAASLGYLLGPNLSLLLRYLSIDDYNAVTLGLAIQLGKK